ncbi:MAG: hypothetical protein VYA86_05730 [Candidatus Thermoplasmatota archaeon]|nr:hypothetical protein [Candidatus Thermoplasmatota archaeon]
MANATTLLLTVALLITPVILFTADRLPNWLRKFPIAVVGIVVLIRFFAFWNIDLTDAQVAGYLPSGVSGLARLLYIFSGPDGLMLGLLFGFAIGLAIRNNNLIEYRWAAFIWILILGWEINPDGFASIASTPLSSQPSILSWRPIAYVGIGFLLPVIVIPTLVGMEGTPSIRNLACFSILIAFIDLTNSPTAWMLFGLSTHNFSALRVDIKRGIASRRRWVGLLLIFVLTLSLLIFAMIHHASGTNNTILWTSRYALGWLLLCSISGALTPLAGFDARPRPEAWGFLSGMIIAPSLLPNLPHIEMFHVPIIVISIIMPLVGTLPEYRPKFSRNRRLFEFLFLSSVLPLVLFSSTWIPISLILVLLIIPLFINLPMSVDEEE